jgi:hypothetical protein
MPEKRRKQVPKFEMKDIMGIFELDDEGNLIIVHDGNKLVDSEGKSVNH